MPEQLNPALRSTVEGDFAEPWKRQRRTATDILRRLEGGQEGVILADQVGMGKTYVALAVAATFVLRQRKKDQVVIFVPARVAEKWVEEWGKFSESLMEEGHGIRCVDSPIRSGEEFLRVLDDPPSLRKHLVVVTHTALTSSMKDSFIQLALMWYASRNRRRANAGRERIARWSEGQGGLLRDRRFTTEIVASLLKTSPDTWRQEWLHLTGQDLRDDPVPKQLNEVIGQIRLDDVWAIVSELPHRFSSNIDSRLKEARKQLDTTTQEVWKQVLACARIRLPLIIIDEAHALKNDPTRISRLFTPREDEPGEGALQDIFEKFLMLTATPFELGHDELIRVLSRLDAVRPTKPLPPEALSVRLDRLHSSLRNAQESAITLEHSWGRLSDSDVSAFDAWAPSTSPGDSASSAVRQAWRDADAAVRTRASLNKELRPWIIRHTREHRRTYLVGDQIRPTTEHHPGGLVIDESDALPFLLAARAQAVAADDDHAGATRPMFAYGIASSYEAYLRLDAGDGDRVLDSDDDADDEPPAPPPHSGSAPAAEWYRQEITRALAEESSRARHPKASATVDRAVALWESGQKCLVFCWYIKTTGALWNSIRTRIDDIVEDRASACLGVPAAQVADDLERLSNRLLRSDTGNYRRIHDHILGRFLAASGDNAPLATALASVAVRSLRSPAYLVRYTRLTPDFTAADLLRGIGGDNPASVDLLSRWAGFTERVAEMSSTEREIVLGHLTGSEAHDGVRSAGRGGGLAQVRRAYGDTGRNDRERLIRMFNTPFAPDILVASSVMGEGIDLHQECSHVIHHDLDWNPGKLEQRTGRLDRIGALAEREGTNISVYEPYLAGTHDEKMFRVVKARAGWFDIVMGRSVGNDENSTDREESRVALHPRILDAMRMDLTST